MYVVSNTSYIEKTSQCHKQMEYETSVDMCHVSERKHTNQNNSQVEIALVKVESSYILTMLCTCNYNISHLFIVNVDTILSKGPPKTTITPRKNGIYHQCQARDRCCYMLISPVKMSNR